MRDSTFHGMSVSGRLELRVFGAEAFTSYVFGRRFHW
jgi:hypothetical protein